MPRSPRAENEEKKYLDTLQRESWHLELIISGLALFGLVAAEEKLANLGADYSVVTGTLGGLVTTGTLVLLAAGFLIFLNLVIHLTVRGLWIGAIGLRSVSGDISFLKLNLSPRFDRFLRRRIGSFDDYIINLDRLSSVIFAFTFMLAMALIGFFLVIGVLIGFIVLNQKFTGSKAANIGLLVLLVIYLLAGLLYFIDFIALGRIKRIKWLAPVYYPIYRLFSWLTLARIYRPIYYNFVDDKLGRKMMLGTIPYILILIFIFNISFSFHDYYQMTLFYEKGGQEPRIKKELYYSDQRKEHYRPIAVEIPSDLISSSVLKVSMPYFNYYDNAIRKQCPDLTPLSESTLSLSIIEGYKSFDYRNDKQSLAPYLTCIAKAVALELDGKSISLDDLIFSVSDNRNYMIMTKYVPLDSIPTGLHTLKFTSYTHRGNEDTLRVNTAVNLPFYYAPE